MVTTKGGARETARRPGHARSPPGSGFAASLGASLIAQLVKNLPAMQETQARSLDREDPLKENLATHSSVLAWRVPWTEEPGRLQALGLQRGGYD